MNTHDTASSFSGFPKGFVDFLFSLQFNNTLDLLPENKQTYKQLITEPLLLLFHSLTETALSVSDSLITRPSKCVSSMYSDMRFSRATPLKGYMYIRFREPFSEKDALGLYFDMGYEHYSYGIRIYKQTSAGMERIRESIIENSQLFSTELEKMERLNMTLFGDKYVKDRYAGVKNEILKDLLNRKSFYIGRSCSINDSVFNGQIQNEISNAYEGLKGIYLLFRKSLYGN
jgi:uncharacterized protein (DUF2461 family)